MKRHIRTEKHTELAETSAGQTKLIAPSHKTTEVLLLKYTLLHLLLNTTCHF